MILTPLAGGQVPALISAFDEALPGEDVARAVFRHIVAVIPPGDLSRLSTDPKHHAQGVALCQAFGLGTVDVDPKTWFTWDGARVALQLEPSVLIHEVGHYQLASPERRSVIDFGLGCGPESGGRAEADAVQTLFCPERDVEEGLCSLLGILWEAELGQPAILAFLEQNWMEGGTSLHNVAHFRKVVRWLGEMALIDAEGHPTRNLRHEGDATFFPRWFSE